MLPLIIVGVVLDDSAQARCLLLKVTFERLELINVLLELFLARLDDLQGRRGDGMRFSVVLHAVRVQEIDIGENRCSRTVLVLENILRRKRMSAERTTREVYIFDLFQVHRCFDNFVVILEANFVHGVMEWPGVLHVHQMLAEDSFEEVGNGHE